jgi:hypothetical protein
VGFAEHVHATVVSMSPDGEFRCTIREWSGGLLSEHRMSIQREAVIERNPVGNTWFLIGREKVDGCDSVETNNYSITWESDKKNKAIGLTVLVDGTLGLKYKRSW